MSCYELGLEINIVIKKIYLAFTLSSTLAAYSLLQAEESPAIKYAPLAIPLADIQWGQPGGGNGFPVGVQSARQGTDPVTGGITYYAKFPAGSHFDMHWHTHDEFVVVVQGSVTIVLGEESHSVSAGSYIVIPGKLKHSWDVPEGTEDAVIVVRRGGPADFHFLER
jgi:mannose-6-phosphate isomerase-like protein (cupin superfamily)